MEAMLRQHIEKIVKLTEEEFEFVLSHFTYKKFKKHQYLIQAGDLCPHLYFITKGVLKSFSIDDTGKVHILEIGMEDWWMTDENGFHNKTVATFNVDCLEDTEVYCISIDDRERLCNAMRKMEYFFLKKTTAGYIALQQRILSLTSKKAEERYSQLISTYPSLIQRVPKSLIASYLGVTRETLSRLQA
ncbi:Crp/Fnr family transcriptional regulator [Chitinophaga pendula]|uniref:Crp/Fnr family transcriptional regulator n=1 Tax=Chitinophaga TaxID=79328 RepID=UPI000BAFF335|nr:MULTISPECIES: Crp/Fnr family transcriptional regulator [Chitinophaga]ASZ13884.1 Crp/Fnr family transcriptional regulator [Chitinophaga sp. MD30]UCJ08496.1 Crp/Fnr family transcriptional regulator [Chitinophaga pendula]